MPLAPGVSVGLYTVLAPIGAGGMGEVYRARDSKLDRDVALKILPPSFSADPDRLARFAREAKAVAALSHPNIVAIHDFGTHAGTAFAAMELLDGESLRARLGAGALPARKAIEIGLQIASGLAAAHDKGIVHRDLKPENVFVTRDGLVKILDFGLAKLQASAGTAGASALPTVAAETAAGVVMGTVGYMAPEQVRGQAADHRADIFAFGAILYEMLAGSRAFSGGSAVEMMNAILKEDPPELSTAGTTVPPVLDRIVRRCLEKQPDERFQSARDLGFALQAISGLTGSTPDAHDGARPARAPGRARSYVIGGLTGAAVAAAAATALWMVAPAAPQPSRRVVRFAVDIPSTRLLDSFVISPDGSHLAYIAAEDGQSRIFRRALNQSVDAVLPGTDGAVGLFFSPDSQWIGFFANGRLRKVPTGGGEVVSITDAAYSEQERASMPTGTWAPDGTVVFSVTGRGLFRVPAAGGAPVNFTVPLVTEVDQLHLWPQVLSDRGSVLFTSSTPGDFDAARVEEAPLAGGSRTTVIASGSRALAMPTGHLLYADRGRLLAIPFSSTPDAAAGGMAIVDRLAYNGKQPLFAVSALGDLTFATQEEPPAPDLFRVDRAGRADRLATVVPGMTSTLSMSPDGSRLAGWRVSSERSMSLLLIDLSRGVLTQLAGEGRNHVPTWLPDGRTLTYSSDRAGSFNLYLQSVDGGAVERLTTSPLHEDPGTWSSDGRWLVYTAAEPKMLTDIWAFDRTTRKSAAFRQTPADERFPTLSPDGRWIAYVSDESKQPQVYVEAFPGGGQRVQLSIDGGTEPVWSASGTEIFYRRDHQLMSVRVTGGPTLSAARPVVVIDAPFDAAAAIGLPSYAVDPDGQHFYFLRNSGNSPRPQRIEVVLNWLDEFKARVSK